MADQNTSFYNFWQQLGTEVLDGDITKSITAAFLQRINIIFLELLSRRKQFSVKMYFEVRQFGCENTDVHLLAQQASELK